MAIENVENFFAVSKSPQLAAKTPVSLVWSDSRFTDRDLPKVSICIPTFQRPGMLLESVHSALAQMEVPDFELIIIDNDLSTSPDDVIAKLKELKSKRIRYFQNSQNLGMFGNWNQCMNLARSEWLTILNDDDFLDTDFLVSALKLRENYPAAKMFAYSNRMLDQRAPKLQGKVRLRSLKKLIQTLSCHFKPRVFKLSLWDYFFSSHHAGTLGVLFDRESGLKIGGFNPDLFPSADHIFWAHFVSQNESYFSPEIKCSYRVLANESLKPKNLLGWVQQGYDFRYFLLRHYLSLPLLSSFFAITTAVETMRTYREFWGEHNMEAEALAGIPVRPFHRTKLAQILNWIIKGFYRAVRF